MSDDQDFDDDGWWHTDRRGIEMALNSVESLYDLADRIVQRAQAAGATVAESVAHCGESLSTKVRLGEPELVEEATSVAIGLRVMQGKRVAITHSNDLTEQGLQRLVEDAIELLKLGEPDPDACVPDPSQFSKRSDWRDIDGIDRAMLTMSPREVLQLALDGEGAARSYDARISNSDGATCERGLGRSVLVTSGGFRGEVEATSASLVVTPVAEDVEGKKQRGSYWTAARHREDLWSARSVGEEAARRTLRQLGSTTVTTQELPVVFDPDTARSVLGLFAGCILGGSIWRKSSYLVNRLESRVASEFVTIIDDPTIVRGPGSRSFDGEGLLSRENVVVDRGVLKTYLLDTYSANKLGMASTASASRGSSGSVGPSTTNFVLQPSHASAEGVLASTPHGLYVTRMMGFGFNAVTGDFSRGASGFMIRGGELAEAVSGVTISLNLDTLLQRIDAVGSDLDLRSSIASPTIRVQSMTLAGA